MLISCPKCHSIYDIPDDLIGKTGKKFRCPVCAHIWHAMREDALGYEANGKDEIPYIEAINVKDAASRNFPADKKSYSVALDTKSGRKTKSSKEIIEAEGQNGANKSDKQKEITLTSEKGTSFTISTIPEDNEEDINKKAPRLFDEEKGMHADKENRLLPDGEFKGYTKTKVFLCLVLLLVLTVFLRREIVSFYPAAEPWYNKVMLSGQHNPQYLKFKKIDITPQQQDEQKSIKITAEITNASHYITVVPALTVNNLKRDFKLSKELLKANESLTAEIILPIGDDNTYQNLTLGFDKP